MDAMAETLNELSPLAQVGLDVAWTVLKLVIILVVGLAIARLLKHGTILLLRKAHLDEGMARIGLEWRDRKGKVRSYAEALGAFVFWVVVVFLVVAALEVLELKMLAGPLNVVLTELSESLPHILKALVILAGAWVLAMALKVILEKGLAAIGFDRWARRMEDREEDLDEEELEAAAVTEPPRRTPSQVAGMIAFYLVLLLALPAFLDALQLDALVLPIQDSLGRVFTFLPELVGALVIFLVGWLVARLLRTIVGEGLTVAGADEAARRVGLGQLLGETRVSQMAAAVVFYVTLLIALVTAVDALGLEAISRPVTTMFTTMVNYVPALLGALVVVAVGVILGRLVRGFVSDLLSRIGFDGILAKIGLGRLEPAREGAPTPSGVVGVAAMVVVVLLFAAEGLELMRLELLSELFGQLLFWLPHLLVAVLILGVGFFLGGWVRDLVAGGTFAAGGKTGVILGESGRAAVLVFAFTMALRQVGIGADVVLQAFTLLFGGVCLAAALAFGIGGREKAAELLARWSSSGGRDERAEP